MPWVKILVGYHIQAVKGNELDETNGGAEVVDVWTLMLKDRQTGDETRISFRRDTRDELVRQLTGGIVLAGGELPRV